MEISCKECGVVFNKKPHTRTIYCSRICRDKKKLKYDMAEWKVAKICKQCGVEFVPINPKQYLCSNGCSKIYNSFEYESTYKGSNKWLKLRFAVFTRDNFTCQYCGRNVVDDKIKLNCDHKIPKTKNGAYTMDNLITACFECNQGKKDVLLEIWLKK